MHPGSRAGVPSRLAELVAARARPASLPEADGETISMLRATRPFSSLPYSFRRTHHLRRDYRHSRAGAATSTLTPAAAGTGTEPRHCNGWLCAPHPPCTSSSLVPAWPASVPAW